MKMWLDGAIRMVSYAVYRSHCQCSQWFFLSCLHGGRGLMGCVALCGGMRFHRILVVESCILSHFGVGFGLHCCFGQIFRQHFGWAAHAWSVWVPCDSVLCFSDSSSSSSLLQSSASPLFVSLCEWTSKSRASIVRNSHGRAGSGRALDSITRYSGDEGGESMVHGVLSRGVRVGRVCVARLRCCLFVWGGSAGRGLHRSAMGCMVLPLGCGGDSFCRVVRCTLSVFVFCVQWNPLFFYENEWCDCRWQMIFSFERPRRVHWLVRQTPCMCDHVGGVDHFFIWLAFFDNHWVNILKIWRRIGIYMV